MIDISVSFWMQSGFILVACPAITFFIIKLLRPGASKCLAGGCGLLLAGVLAFLFSYVVLQYTSSGGRGFGALIFVFVLLAEAVIGGTGALLILIAGLRRLFYSQKQEADPQ